METGGGLPVFSVGRHDPQRIGHAVIVDQIKDGYVYVRNSGYRLGPQVEIGPGLGTWDKISIARFQLMWQNQGSQAVYSYTPGSIPGAMYLQGVHDVAGRLVDLGVLPQESVAQLLTPILHTLWNSVGRFH
jgi:hypothetical protein